MMYAKIDVLEEVYNAREKSVPLQMIFKGTNCESILYAPKSRIKVIDSYIPPMATNKFITILVPMWIFTKNGFNPCQVATGFRETVKA